MIEKMQSGGYMSDAEKEQKKREKAAERYRNESNPLDVINNPYYNDSQYLDDAREIKFAPKNENVPTSQPSPSYTEELGKKFDFMVKYMPLRKTQSDLMVTPHTIYESGYGDLYYGKNYKYDPYNMPKNLDKVRYELNKDDNFSKSLSMFKNNFVQAVGRSLKSWMIWNVSDGGWGADVDNTGSFEDVMMNGYSGIVRDPDKADQKFTKEYWMEQFASLGTSAGMGAEMLAEGLLLKGLGKVGGAVIRRPKASIDAAVINRRGKMSKEGIRAENRAAMEAGKGNVAEANRIIENTNISPTLLAQKQRRKDFVDYASGALMGVRNAALNYQFTYEEVYNDALRHGANEETAKDIAKNSALNAFKIECVASAMLNSMQTRLIHSMTRNKFDEFNRIMRAAVTNKTSLSEIAPLSAKRTFWKNAGKFVGSALMEGFEEVMEDGIAMIGREQAYHDDYDRWTALGMSYRANENYSQLVDSFIGGLLGGTVFSSVRVGLGAAMGRTETQQVKKQQKMLDDIKKSIEGSASRSAASQLDARKKIAELNKKFENGEEIESGGKKYSSKLKDGSENPEYRTAYEIEKNKVFEQYDRSARLVDSLNAAAYAVKAMGIIGGNEASGMMLQNIQNLRDRSDTINKIISADENSVNEALDYFSQMDALQEEIEKLEKEGNEEGAEQKRNEYNELKESAKDYSDLITSIAKTKDVFMNDDGSMSYDKDKFNSEKSIVDSQIMVTNMFNHSFYNYYGTVNDDMEAAIRYAMNSTQRAMNNMRVGEAADSIMSSVERLISSATMDDPNYFDGTDERDVRLRKMAFAYNLFKKMNTGGQYDFVLGTLVSKMAFESGRFVSDKTSGLDFNDISEQDVLRYDRDATYYAIKGYIDEYNINGFSMIGDFVELSSMRDTIALFQTVFSDTGGRYANIRDFMSVEDYDTLFSMMKKGDYRGMIDLCEEILKDMENGKERAGQLFSQFLKENKESIANIKNEEDAIQKKLDELGKTSADTILFSFKGYGDDAIGDSRLTDAMGDELDEIVRKREIRDILRRAFNGDKDAIAEIEKYESERQAAEAECNRIASEFNEAKRFAADSRENIEGIKRRFKIIENLDGDDEELGDALYAEIMQIATDVLKRYGSNYMPINVIDLQFLNLPEDFKNEMEAFLKEHTSADERGDATIKVAMKVLEQEAVEPVMSEEQTKKLDEAQEKLKSLMEDGNVIGEAKMLYDAINRQIVENEQESKRLNEELVILKWKADNANDAISRDRNWLDNKQLEEILKDLDTKYHTATLPEYVSDTKLNVSKNAFRNEAQYGAFFNTKDNRVSKVIGEVRREALKVAPLINSSRQIERYNASLRTGMGVATFRLRQRYYDVMNMPETDVKSLKRKMRKLRKVMRQCYFQQQMLSSEEAQMLWEDAGESLLVAHEYLEKRIASLENSSEGSSENVTARKFDGIVESMDREADDDTQEDVFDIDKAENDTVYYAEGNDDLARLVAGANVANAKNVVMVPADTIFLYGRSERVIYKDKSGNVHYYADDGAETGKVETNGNKTAPPAASPVTPISQGEPPQSGANNTQSGQNKGGSPFRGNAFMKSLSVDYGNGNFTTLPLMTNIIYAIDEAKSGNSYFGIAEHSSARTENRSLVSYVADRLFNGNKGKADLFIIQMSQVIGLGRLENDFFKKLVHQGNLNYMFWQCAGEYAIAMFDDCSSPNDVEYVFNNYAAKYAPTARFGQQTPPVGNSVSGYEQKKEERLDKLAQSEGNKKKYGINPAENRGKYNGDTGLTVNQSFSTNEESGVASATLFNESGSVITSEGVEELERLGETVAKGHALSLPQGIADVISDNIGLFVRSNDKAVDTAFIHALKGLGVFEKIRNNISVGNSWDFELEDKRDKVISAAEENAVIMLRSDGKIVGWLPEAGRWRFTEVRVKTETVQELKESKDKKNAMMVNVDAYTDAACESHKRRCEALNKNLLDFRKSVIAGTAPLSVDASLSRSNRRGKQVKSFSNISYGNQDMPEQLASTKESVGIKFVRDDHDHYRFHLSEMPGMYPVMPGWQNYDGATVTTISDSNMTKPNFMLSHTAKNVAIDTKYRLQKICYEVLAFLSATEKGRNVLGVLLANEGNNPEYLSLIATAFGDYTFENYKGNGLEEGVFNALKELSVQNSASIRERYSGRDNVPFIMFGSTKMKADGKHYTEKFDDGDGIVFYFGTPVINGDKIPAPVVIPKNGDITIDDLKKLLDMMIGRDVEKRIDSLTIPWASPGYGYPANGIQFGERQMAVGFNRASGLVFEKGNTLWTATRDGFTEPTGAFDVDLGNGTMAQMTYAGYNMEFGNPVIYSDASDPESLANPATPPASSAPPAAPGGKTNVMGVTQVTGGPDVQIPDPSAGQTDANATDTKGVSTFINKAESDVGKMRGAKESVAIATDEMGWMPDMSSLEQWMGSVTRVIMNRCRKIKDKNGNPIQLGDITIEMLSDKLVEFLNGEKEQFEKFEKGFLYSMLVLENKREHTTAVGIANDIIAKYPFLDKDSAIAEAQEYIDNKDDYKVKPFLDRFTGKPIYTGESEQLRAFNEAMTNAKITSVRFQQIVFSSGDGLFQQHISDYLNYEKLYVLDEERELMEDAEQYDEDGNNGRLWSDENTTPLISGMGMEMKLLFATLPVVAPVMDGNGKIKIDSRGMVECELTSTDRFCNFASMAQCYPLGDVINLLAEVGKRNKGYTFDSLLNGVKELASTNNKWTGLAVSLYECLSTINDPAMIQLINYKLNDMEASNFIYMDDRTDGEDRYLNVNNSVENTTVGSVMKKIESHARDIISAGEVYVPLMGKYVKIVESGKFNNNVRAIIDEYINKIFAIEKANGMQVHAVEKINNIAEFAKLEKYHLADESVMLLQQLLNIFTGWQFDEKTIRMKDAGWSFALKTLLSSCQNLSAAVVEYDPKNKKGRSQARVVPMYLNSYNRNAFKSLVRDDMEFNFIPESRSIKTGGLTVQPWTQRTMSTKRLLEMQDDGSQKRTAINDAVSATKKESTDKLMKVSCWPQYESIKSAYRGLYDITVYRTNGRTSGKITSLPFEDQVYIRSNTFFGYSGDTSTSEMRWLHERPNDKRKPFDMIMRKVPDFTDSNKTKSGYWFLPCLNTKKHNSRDAVEYMTMALFDNEIRRIFRIATNENVRKGEKLMLTCPSYNTIKITDIDGSVVTLAKFLDGITKDNIDLKWSTLIKQYYSQDSSKGIHDKSIEETEAILDKYVRDLCGIGLYDSESDVKFENVNESAFCKSGLIECSTTDGKTIIITNNRIGSWSYYSKDEGDSGKRKSDALARMRKVLSARDAAVDFAVNDIVSKMFVLNEVEAGGYELAAKKASAVDVSSEQSLERGLRELKAALEANTYKRQAGVLTGGQALDYTCCYKDRDRNDIEEYKDWGGVDHDEFLYLVCEETSGIISDNIAYYGRLYYSKRWDDEEKKKPEDKRVSIWEKHKPGTAEPWFGEPEKYRKQIEKNCPDLKAYMSINSTDGQEYCTWREAVDTMQVKGKISIEQRDAMRKAYTKIENGEELTGDDQEAIDISIQVFKMVYCGVGTENTADERMDYVKSSVAPLLPQNTIGLEKLDGIRRAMEAVERTQHRNVHLAFKSAIKVGCVTKGNITIDEISECGNAGDVSTLADCIVSGNRKYLSIQNETDTKVHTKVDKKNAHKKVLVANSESAIMKSASKGFNAGFATSKMVDDFGLDISDRYTQYKIASFFAYLLQNKEHRNNDLIYGEVLRQLKTDRPFESLNRYLKRHGVLFLDKSNAKSLMSALYNRKIEETAWSLLVDEVADSKDITEDMFKEKVEQIRSMSKEELKKEFNIERNDSDEYFETFENAYSEAAELVDSFIDDFMNNAENVELTTVELTQFQHLATSGGIAKIRDEIFDVNLENILGRIGDKDNENPIRKYLEGDDPNRSLLGNFIITKTDDKGKPIQMWKTRINGEQLEQLRNAFEIVETCNDVLDFLYNDLGIISKNDYERYKELHVIPPLGGLVDTQAKIDRIKAAVVRELIQRGSDSSSVDMINNDMPLLLNPDVTRIENLLMALVRKHASRSYMNGTSLFLMSQHGFEQEPQQRGKLKVKGDEKLMATKGVVWTDANREPGRLRAMKVSEDGKKLFLAECAISPQFTFFDGKEYKQVNLREVENGHYKYLCDAAGNKVKPGDNTNVFLDKKMVDPKLLEIISLRVPTSGLMNTCALKIVAFLPNTMSGCIMVPQEHIAQFGEDFDIDKRFCYMYGYYIDSDGAIRTVDDGYVNRMRGKYKMFERDPKYKDLIGSLEYSLKSNRKMDIYMAVMKCKDSKVQEHLNLTLEWQNMTDTRNALVQNKEYAMSDLRDLPHSMLNQTRLSVDSTGSLTGVGVWADCGTYNAILSKQNVILKHGTRRMNILVEGNALKKDVHDKLIFNGNLSGAMTISHKNDTEKTKIAVISEELQVCVDSVKEDVVPHINENSATYPFFTMMAMMGFYQTRLVKIPKFDGNAFEGASNGFKDAPLQRLDLKSMVAVQPAVKALTEMELGRKSVVRKQYQSSKDMLVDVIRRLGVSDDEISEMEKGTHQTYRITSDGVLERKGEINDNGCYSVDYKYVMGQYLYNDSVYDIDTHKTQDFAMRQLDVLSFFTTIRNYGNMMQKYKNLFTVSSKGAGKLYFNVFDKIEALNDLAEHGRDGGVFDGLASAIGMFVEKSSVDECPKGFYDIYGLDYYVKPTTVEGNTVLLSLQTANMMLGTAMGYLEPGLRTVIDSMREIYAEREIFQNARQRVDRRVLKDLSTYTMLYAAATCDGEGVFRKYDANMDPGVVIQLERIRLIEAEKEAFKKAGGNTAIESYAKEKIGINLRDYAFSADDNFFVTINTLRTTHKKYAGSPLMTSIVRMSDNTFGFRIDENSPYAVRRIQNQLIDMFYHSEQLRSDGYSTRDFVKDFIAMAIVMDDKQGISSFRNIIPVQILKDLGMLKSMKIAVEEMRSGHIDPFRFVEQFVFNNSTDLLTYVSDYSKVAKGLSYSTTNNVGQLSNGDSFMIEYDSDKSLEDALKDRGIFNKKRDGSFPWLVMFRAKNGKDNYIYKYNAEKSRVGVLVYDVMVVEGRNETGRNYYNPFMTAQDATRGYNNKDLFNPEAVLANIKASMVQGSESSKNNNNVAFDEIAAHLSRRHEDPILKLLKSALKNNILGDISLQMRKSSFDEVFLSRVSAMVGHPYMIDFNTKFGVDSYVGWDQVMHEEMFHILIGGYFEANVKEDSSGNLILTDEAKSRLQRTLDHFYSLRDKYIRLQNANDPRCNRVLDHIFNSGSGTRSDFNEFIANIMSANQYLTDFILDEKQEKHIWDWVQDIIDFVKYICSISDVHKDVANEVEGLLWDMYIDNSSSNMKADVVNVMNLYRQSAGKIGLDTGRDVVRNIDSYMKKKHTPNAKVVYVSNFASNGMFEKTAVMDDDLKKKLDIGTFIDRVFRTAFNNDLKESEIRSMLAHFQNPEGLHMSYTGPLVVLENSTIDKIISIVKKIRSNGGIEHIYNEEIPLLSEFVVKYKGDDAVLSGKPDIVIVDRSGFVHVIDIKTHRRKSQNDSLFNEQGANQTLEGYVRQLWCYKMMLGEASGARNEDIRCYILEADYNDDAMSGSDNGNFDVSMYNIDDIMGQRLVVRTDEDGAYVIETNENASWSELVRKTRENKSTEFNRKYCK